MKIKYKPKQSTNNSTKRIIRDSNPKTVVGTLVGFILVWVASIIVGGGNNSVFAASYEYSIKYNDNVVDNMPMDVNDGKAVGGNLSLASNTPKRDGYKFLGWCNTIPSTNTTDDTDSCSGTTYQPGAGITIASAANFHFYASWEKVFTLADATKMQDSFSCTDTPDSTTNILTDTRDNKTYTVAKINGACWMTQNLAIEPGTHMTADDTNITSSQYNNATYYALPGSGYDLKANASSSSDNCYGTGRTNSNYSGGGWVNACTHIAGDADIDDTDGRYTKQQLGAWYNYAAATAGTIYGTSAASGTAGNPAEYSICPKGWTLPSYDTNSPTGSINGVLNYVDLLNPLYGGWWGNGSHGVPSRSGIWWSATFHSARFRYDLDYDNGSLTPYQSGSLSTYQSNRYVGNYVRCVRTS